MIATLAASTVRLFGLIAVLGGIANIQSGCAIRYTDRQGNLTTIGFVWYAVPPPQPVQVAEPARIQMRFRPEVLPAIPLALRQRSLGLIVDASSYRRGIALGFQETLLVLPADDAVTEFSFDSERPLDARINLNP